MATTTKKTTSYKSPTISNLTSNKTSTPKVVIPKVAPGPQSKVPTTYTIPKVAPGPQSKVPTQSTVPTYNMPVVAPGPQSKVPTTSKSSKSSGSSSSTYATTSGGGTYNYVPPSLQALTSDLATSSSARTSAPTPASGSTSPGGANAGGSFAAGSSDGGGGTDDSPAAQLEAAKKQLAELQKQAALLGSRDDVSINETIVTDSDLVKQEKDAANMLKKLREPRDTGLDMLGDEIKRNEQLLQQELSSIKDAYNVQKTDVEGQQRNELGQTSVALANAGGYLGFSGSGTGVMLKLAESHRAELTSLESQRQNALYEAQAAAANRRFDMVQMKVDEIARIDQEKYERTQEYYARVKENAEVEKVKAERQQTENSIYTAIQAGAKSAEDIFAVLGGAVSAEEINNFLKTIVPDSVRDVGAGFKFSATNTASLLGAGLGQADIQALNEYVNENGYDETVRSNLTPLQRAAADKIFKSTEGGTSSGFGKPMSILDLDRLEESYGVRFPFGTTQAEATQFFNDNPGATPEEMQAALDGAIGGGTTGPKIDFTTDYLKNELTKDQQKKLADLVGASSWWTGATTDIDRMFSVPSFLVDLNERIDDLRSQGIADQEIIDALTS